MYIIILQEIPVVFNYLTGKYRLVRRIGSGSFGDVYLGTNILTGEEVTFTIIGLV